MGGTAHWRVSGAVGQATTTAETAPALICARANSSAGRVLPAPGAADSRNEPLSQSAIRVSARVCQRRSEVRLDLGRGEGTGRAS